MPESTRLFTTKVAENQIPVDRSEVVAVFTGQWVRIVSLQDILAFDYRGDSLDHFDSWFQGMLSNYDIANMKN